MCGGEKRCGTGTHFFLSLKALIHVNQIVVGGENAFTFDHVFGTSSHQVSPQKIVYDSSQLFVGIGEYLPGHRGTTRVGMLQWLQWNRVGVRSNRLGQNVHNVGE